MKTSMIAELERHIGQTVTIHGSGADHFSGRLAVVHPDGCIIERVTSERKEYGPDRTHQSVTSAFVPWSGVSHVTVSHVRVVEG